MRISKAIGHLSTKDARDGKPDPLYDPCRDDGLNDGTKRLAHSWDKIAKNPDCSFECGFFLCVDRRGRIAPSLRVFLY